MDTVKDLPETGITPGGPTGAFRDVLSRTMPIETLHFADIEDERIAKARSSVCEVFGSSSLPAITMAFRCGCRGILDFPRTSVRR